MVRGDACNGVGDSIRRVRRTVPDRRRTEMKYREIFNIL